MALKCFDKTTAIETIIAALRRDGAVVVNELAEPFDMQLPAVSKHLKVLERAGLITRGRHAQYRPCALDAAPLAEVADWTEQYRPIWEARFDRLDDYLTQLQRQTARHVYSPTGSGTSARATPEIAPTETARHHE